jgi:NADH:ubiquinone oxidoreductase subunit 6 (subunit J)
MIALGVIFCVMLAAAALAMSLRNLIHSALLLTLNWVGLAAFYLWAGAEFVAFAQVLVYVGAVSMIVLFAVLLTRRSREGDGGGARLRASEGRFAAAMMTTAIVAGVLGAAVISTDFDSGPAMAPTITVKQIGQLLMGPQVAALLVIGVLLTVALIGAIVIASSDHEEDRG